LARRSLLSIEIPGFELHWSNIDPGCIARGLCYSETVTSEGIGYCSESVAAKERNEGAELPRQEQ